VSIVQRRGTRRSFVIIVGPQRRWEVKFGVNTVENIGRGRFAPDVGSWLRGDVEGVCRCHDGVLMEYSKLPVVYTVDYCIIRREGIRGQATFILTRLYSYACSSTHPTMVAFAKTLRLLSDNPSMILPV